jgi:hypothetical protein
MAAEVYGPQPPLRATRPAASRNYAIQYQRESRDQAELEAIGDEVELARVIEKDLSKY